MQDNYTTAFFARKEKTHYTRAYPYFSCIFIFYGALSTRLLMKAIVYSIDATSVDAQFDFLSKILRVRN